MRKTFNVSAIMNGVTYTACLIEDGETCLEFVIKHESMGGRMIHEAEFETKLLGAASRDSYLRSVLASMARSDQRQERESDLDGPDEQRAWYDTSAELD